MHFKDTKSNKTSQLTYVTYHGTCSLGCVYIYTEQHPHNAQHNRTPNDNTACWFYLLEVRREQRVVRGLNASGANGK